MQKNQNHNKESLRPQCNQVRIENSETNSEPHSFMETEQPAAEWLLDELWNESRNKDVLWNQWEQRHNVPESLRHI